MSAARRRVLDALVSSRRPLDAAEVGARAGVHVTTARFHLDRLVGDGLADRRPIAEQRRGRPRVLYSPAGPPRDEEARDQLIRVLAAALAQDDRTEAVIRAGRDWAAAFDPPGADDPARGLVGVLDRLGFDPEEERAGGAAAIRLRACPFRDSAREHPEIVCAAHRGLVEELVEGTALRASLHPFVEPLLCTVTLGPAPQGAPE